MWTCSQLCVSAPMPHTLYRTRPIYCVAAIWQSVHLYLTFPKWTLLVELFHWMKAHLCLFSNSSGYRVRVYVQTVANITATISSPCSSSRSVKTGSTVFAWHVCSVISAVGWFVASCLASSRLSARGLVFSSLRRGTCAAVRVAAV